MGSLILISLCNTNQSTTGAAGCEMLFWLVLYLVRTWCINQEKQVGLEYTFKIVKHYQKCTLLKYYKMIFNVDEVICETSN